MDVKLGRSRERLEMLLFVAVLALLQCSSLFAYAESASGNCTLLSNKTECCASSADVSCGWCINQNSTASDDGKCVFINGTEYSPNCGVNTCSDKDNDTTTVVSTTHETDNTTETTTTVTSEGTTTSTSATISSSTMISSTHISFTTSEATSGTVTANDNSTTAATTSATTPPPCQSHSSFDGGSFVGGIVLGLGLCAIAFFLYKWYTSRHPSSSPYQQF